MAQSIPMNRLLTTVSTMGCCKCKKGAKVALLGAGGGIGQPLALLLKKLPGISTLNLFDVSTIVHGVAADLSHIDTPTKVTSFCGQKDLEVAVANVDIVVIPAGVPRKPGMTRDDLFNVNASIVSNLTKACAKACPNAYILIVTNPVNSTIPIAAEVLKRMGVYNPKKLLGVTTLDVVRANTFVSEKLNVCPNSIKVPVIGGHAGITIIPLMSQVPGSEKLGEKTIKALTKRIMFGGDEVVAAKEGKGSATLSMAHSATKLVASVLRALDGETVTECAFVESEVCPGVPFFASPVVLGANGIVSIPPLPALSAFEGKLVQDATKELSVQIKKGIKFGQTFKL